VLVGKQADGEGMGLLNSGSGRGGAFNYHKEQKGLTKGTNIEAVIHYFKINISI
jgi:hypothetical protein